MHQSWVGVTMKKRNIGSVDAYKIAFPTDTKQQALNCLFKPNKYKKKRAGYIRQCLDMIRQYEATFG